MQVELRPSYNSAVKLGHPQLYNVILQSTCNVNDLMYRFAQLIVDYMLALPVK